MKKQRKPAIKDDGPNKESQETAALLKAPAIVPDHFVETHDIMRTIQ